MKTAIITIIVILAFLPFMFCTPQAHEVGTVQGDGDAKPLDPVETGDSPTAEINGGGLIPTASEQPNETQAVVLIVSTEPAGEINGMNTVAILCFNNGREWRGVATGWSMDRRSLRYEAVISLDFKKIIVKEFVIGQKTKKTFFVRFVKGVE